jgi:hypothetical protein
MARAGWTVYATVRQLADGEALVAEAGGGEIKPLQLDVTDDAQIAALEGALRSGSTRSSTTRASSSRGRSRRCLLTTSGNSSRSTSSARSR